MGRTEVSRLGEDPIVPELVIQACVRFPHRNTEIGRRDLRRGRMSSSIATFLNVFAGKSLKSRRCYMIAVRNYGRSGEW